MASSAEEEKLTARGTLLLSGRSSHGDTGGEEHRQGRQGKLHGGGTLYVCMT